MRAQVTAQTRRDRDLRKGQIGHFDHQKMIGYSKMDASPVTLGIDIELIKMAIADAAAGHHG